jgi:hypothetical protein
MFPLLEASVATEKNISSFKSAVPKLRIAMPWGRHGIMPKEVAKRRKARCSGKN